MTDEELKMKSYIVITISVRFYNITGLKQNKTKKTTTFFPFIKSFRYGRARSRDGTSAELGITPAF